MSEKIKVFGVPASPYTQKMISILRYRHIAYEVFMGDVPGRLSRLEEIEPPKPILLPTLLLEDESGKYLIPITEEINLINDSILKSVYLTFDIHMVIVNSLPFLI